MKKILGILICLMMLGLGVAHAAFVTFVPPTDPLGGVYSTNSNDGYSDGRGMAFEILSNVTIDSIGIYQDLENIDLSFEIAQTTSRVGEVTIGQTILRSGSALENTIGLEFIDFSFSPLTLLSGNYYHIEFTFSGDSNQNFFYTQLDTPDFNQGDFLFINGTQSGNTDNYVIPAMRVNTVSSEVPEPTTMLLLGSGLLGLLGFRRKFRK